MIPANTAWADTPAGKTPKRFAFVGFPHGAIMDHWSPKETGTSYTMSPILSPLEPYRKHMTIVSGLRNKPAETPEPHAYIEQGWLTAVKPWTSARRIRIPASAPIRSPFAMWARTRVCRRLNSPSGRAAPVSHGARRPSRCRRKATRARSSRSSSTGRYDQERARILAETGSILDRVQGQAKRLQSSVNAGDRNLIGDYLDSVREIERRVQMAEKASNSDLVVPDAPIGTPNDLTNTSS